MNDEPQFPCHSGRRRIDFLELLKAIEHTHRVDVCLSDIFLVVLAIEKLLKRSTLHFLSVFLMLYTIDLAR